MQHNLTLGSLFDGSGGFPLAGLNCEITPIFSSEVEPFPIAVTRARLPQVKHLGDICKIDGGAIEPVDIITFGSPCTNLSIAGRREGLVGQQSVLFYQAIRIIMEMRAATNGKFPRFCVWENVPGAFSSNKGEDFHAVLTAFVQVVEPTAEVPAPAQNKWATADAIVGDGWSIAYRVIDAQRFGIAQRRARVYLVADFASERAGDILFEREGVSRDFTPRICARQGTAGGAADCVGGTGFDGYNGAVDDKAATLGVNCGISTGRNGVIGFEPGAASRLGGHTWRERTGALRADAGDNQTAVVYDARGNGDGETANTITGDHENRITDYTALVASEAAVAIEHHPQDSRVKISEDGVVQTLASNMGEGGGNVPLVASFMGGQGSKAGGIGYSEEVAPTLRSESGGNSVPMVINERQYALTVGEDLANTLTGTDFKGTQCVFEPFRKGTRPHNATEGQVWESAEVANTLNTFDVGESRCNELAVVAFAQNQREEVRDLGDCAGAISAEPGSHQQTYVLHEKDGETLAPQLLKVRCGKQGGGKGALIQDNISATLGCNNDQTLFEPKMFGIDAQNSNSMKSANPNSGIHEMDTARTLDTTSGASGNGGSVIVMEGNGQRPSHKGSGIGEDVSFTLNTIERQNVCYQDVVSALTTELAHQTGAQGQNGGQLIVETEREPVCYQEKVGALCASDYKFPQNQQIDEDKAVVERVLVENYQHSGYREVATAGTLKASGGDYPGGENLAIENRYVVRRLTPQECALLQGFPSDWCAELGIENPTEEDIAFWTEVWETHRKIVGTSGKPKSRKQIVKWLQDPHSDSAEYKLWGNGIALPCAVFVLRGIVEVCNED
jgi:DNA (cytosine-5)-methyltransferase 1